MSFLCEVALRGLLGFLVSYAFAIIGVEGAAARYEASVP
jgi:hypothetical protein